jgi:hypothetical protein
MCLEGKRLTEAIVPSCLGSRLFSHRLRKPGLPGYLARRTRRMMIGMGIPSSHKRIGIGSSFRSTAHHGRGTRRCPFHVPSRS